MPGIKYSIGADASKAERELSSFEQKTRKIAKSIQKGFQERIGHKLFDGLAGAARQIPAFLNEAIQSASSLNEAIGKSEIIFGDSAKSIKTWSETTADSLGMANLDAIAAAGNFGAIFKALGFGEAEMAKMSRTLVNLAADMGSVNEVSNEEALTALLAAMRGESEPISRLGVNFREATLQAKAFQMGLHDGKGALDAKTKALAAYGVILEQTKWQQGNFAKTSDGLANSKKILSAQFKNASTEIGKALLPAMQALVDLMREIDWEEIAKDVGAFAEGFAILAKNVGDAYNSFKSFPEEAMKTLGILDDIKKKTSDMSIFAGEFESPSKTEEGDRFDRGTKALEDAIERDKERGDRFDRGTKALEDAIERDKERIEYQKRLKALQDDLAENEIKKAQEVARKKKELIEKEAEERKKLQEITKKEFESLTMMEAEALAEFGFGDGQKKQARVQELVSSGMTREDAQEIAGRESNVEKLFRTRDMLSNLANQSNVLAVSSMQRIGGGGGVTTQLDLQKRQATLQEQMVRLLEQIKDQSPRENISDF